MLDAHDFYTNHINAFMHHIDEMVRLRLARSVITDTAEAQAASDRHRLEAANALERLMMPVLLDLLRKEAEPAPWE